MATLTDRFRFLARAGQREKTPIRAEAPSTKAADGTAVLRLYDPIDVDGGYWGVSAREFAAVLDDLSDDVTTIELHINSPGGSAWDGLAMMNTLRQHKARVVAIVDGIAASAASVVMLGADEVLVAQGGEIMVHSPWALGIGNHEDLRQLADRLEHEARNMAGLYAAKAGGAVDEWLAVMSAETWYLADEAVAAGLADRVLAKPADDQAKARFDLSVFAYAGRSQAPAPHSPATTSVSGSTENPEESMSLTDAQVADLRTRLGITDENADGDTILAALDEALTEQTTPPPPATDDITPAALAEVTRLSSELADLKAQAAKREKDEHFASWLRDGKTSPAEINGKDGKDGLAAMYDAAPTQTVALVSARAKGSVVPVAAIGHDAGEDEEPITAEAIRATPAYLNWKV